MKKFTAILLTLVLALSLAACGSNDTTSEATTGTTAAEDTSTPTEVTITSLNGNGDPTDLTVPYDPQRIAILDMASLDILDALGLGDRVELITVKNAGHGTREFFQTSTKEWILRFLNRTLKFDS